MERLLKKDILKKLTKENVIYILTKYKSLTPSKWKEKAEWRKENKLWLKKAQYIALLILDGMEDLHMSQEELAEKLKIPSQNLKKILQGSEDLSLKIICELEQILNLDIFSSSDTELPMKIPSPFTKGIAILHIQSIPFVFKEALINIDYHFYICEKTQQQFTNSSSDRYNYIKMFEKYNTLSLIKIL